MSKIDRKVDREEAELLDLFNKGQLQSVASPSELAHFKAAA
jgi:hypothetical protein